ncbi:STAS domain-containing protein [Nonomuraea aurantiaca]|uniref:STAS domain-containing protein n=1 Tax=Nonomuraea aurantiaca TaxID=2878562 RepID=UPI001CDA307E|nr:STAS domain-containing protein [Nonomuraea aurantiaca]MCA2228565.1 STAS domain-containing protein [Nonomuraea aurantiaca]
MTALHPRIGTGLWLVPATATVVRLCDELDIGTGEAVRERLLRALWHSTSLLVLDLSGVSFCDAAGLGVVVGVQRRARSLGIVLGLAAPRPHLARSSTPARIPDPRRSTLSRPSTSQAASTSTSTAGQAPTSP